MTKSSQGGGAGGGESRGMLLTVSLLIWYAIGVDESKYADYIVVLSLEIMYPDVIDNV